MFLQLCDVTEQEHLLAEMEQCSPTTDIRAIYTRYTRYSKLAGRKNSVQVLSVEDRGCGGELVVAIKVLSSLLPLRIMVDGSAYGEPRRKSLRLSKSHHAHSKYGGENERPVEITGVMVPPPPPPPPTPPGTEGCDPSNSPISSELWSECYQPVRASEVLSNTAQVQQLYQWMVRWEERATAQRGSLVASGDMASTKPACSKQAADRTRGNSDGDSDGDFVATTHRRATRAASSDSDSMADASNLCPVALLCGPHGSGKTAAVLACAEELGFKVCAPVGALYCYPSLPLLLLNYPHSPSPLHIHLLQHSPLHTTPSHPYMYSILLPRSSIHICILSSSPGLCC